MTTLSKFARTTLISVVATVALAGAASATADISNTGSHSSNTIETTSSNHVEVSNTNNVTVNNSNNQSANTGSASVKENTTSGSAMTGDATNSNSVSTTIALDNTSSTNCICNPGKGGDGGSVGGSDGGTSHVAGGGSTGVGGGSSKSVGILPETGASNPVDVSALRNLFNPASQTTPLSAAVKANRTLSVVAIAVAAILSLFGAIGTAVYSTKRTLKV